MKPGDMLFPAFYDQVRTITLRDSLAEFLGAASGGLIEYGYADAVKLAGHSCPTIAGAYLMTLKGLEALYQNSTAERGAVRVRMRDGIESGVTGVVANVVGMITGATQKNGFKGIGGRFDRRDLLFFNTAITADIRFERVDSDAAVEVTYRPGLVQGSARLKALLGKIGEGGPTGAELQEFGEQWQARVRSILIDNIDDPVLISVARCEAA